MIYYEKNGFTFLELIIASSLFFIVSLSMSRILFTVTSFNKKIYIEEELFENARISMSFFETQIRTAESIKITYNKGHTLNKMELRSGNELHTFRYYYTSDTAYSKYQRLEFGDNELSNYIKDIIIIYDKENDFLNIEIITDDKLNFGESIVEPIVLKRKISVEHKSIEAKE